MPLTEKGKTILANMKKQYGDKKGESVFYASKEKGVITSVHKVLKKAKKRLDKVFKKR